MSVTGANETHFPSLHTRMHTGPVVVVVVGKPNSISAHTCPYDHWPAKTHFVLSFSIYNVLPLFLFASNLATKKKNEVLARAQMRLLK